MSVFVEAKILADIPQELYIELHNMRKVDDDKDAQAIVKSIRKIINIVALSAFNEGLEFDVSKHHVTFKVSE